MDDFHGWLSATWKAVASGIAGALVAAAAAIASRKPAIVVFTTFVCGALMAAFLTEPLVDWLGKPKMSGAVGFLVGSFGVALMMKLMSVIDVINGEELAEWLRAVVRRFLGLPPK